VWKEEVKTKGPAKASLIRVLFRLQRFELGLGTVFSILQAILFSVGRPLLLGEIIHLVADPASTNLQGAFYALLFAAVILAEGIIQAQVNQLLELGSCEELDSARYGAVDKWARQLRSLHNAVIAKLA
jgi:hypothetical protein